MFIYLFIYLLNILDILTTLYLVGTGIGREGNPLMAYLLNISPILFVCVKMGLITGCIYVLYKNREAKMINRMAWLIAGFYMAVVMMNSTLILYLKT